MAVHFLQNKIQTPLLSIQSPWWWASHPIALPSGPWSFIPYPWRIKDPRWAGTLKKQWWTRQIRPLPSEAYHLWEKQPSRQAVPKRWATCHNWEGQRLPDLDLSPPHPFHLCQFLCPKCSSGHSELSLSSRPWNLPIFLLCNAKMNLINTSPWMYPAPGLF